MDAKNNNLTPVTAGKKTNDHFGKESIKNMDYKY